MKSLSLGCRGSRGGTPGPGQRAPAPVQRQAVVDAGPHDSPGDAQGRGKARLGQNLRPDLIEPRI